jgi:hypothetical protein
MIETLRYDCSMWKRFKPFDSSEQLMRSTNMYCSSYCISVSSDLAIGYAPQCLAIPLHVQNSYIARAMAGMVRGSKAGRGKWVVLQNAQTGSGAHPASYLIRTGILPGHEVHFHRVPRLRMSGALPRLPLYAFMACAGAAVYFNPNFVNCDRTV